VAQSRAWERRLAERQANLGQPREGRVFEHGPAKFLFITLIVLVVVVHVGALIVMMTMGLH
jgi:flagellar basal body-associated protein FliL